jgi:glycosyltransferase involved in cell wall biosynthesis
MKIVFFTFYYPPDLSAGSFRTVALAKSLSSKMDEGDEIHVITTHPNRYANHSVKADDLEVVGKITVHRIEVPRHQSGMVSQARSFGVYAVAAYRLCLEINPDFLIGTTSRLMTGVLTGVSAFRLRKKYFIDLRDIFSETISDLLSLKSRLLGAATKLIFSMFEKYLFSGAIGVNVVSEGFPDYFKQRGVDVSAWSFFPNGVDQEFIEISSESKRCRDVSIAAEIKTILYAGNIGRGQGLESIIPKLAKQLGDSFRFVVVGGGGRESLLREAVEREGVNNVEMRAPVIRTELMSYYRTADILFLHLNNVPAFRRVLPSKIFEYAALGKPIVAGVSGYSAKFLEDEIPYASQFESSDLEGGYKATIRASESVVTSDVVDQFVKKYSRVSIMDKMAEHVIKLTAVL